ncbi:MAG: AAA family ATPase [Phycisphaerae bacterium]
MIDRIHIKGYKSLRDVEVELEPLTVLFGPNAAGKSNFLDALQLLSRMITSETLKDAFEPPYRGKPLESFSFPPGGIGELLQQESARFSIEVDMTLSRKLVDRVNREISELRKPHGEREQGEEGTGTSPRVREHRLRYMVEVQIRPQSGILEVTNELLAPLTAKGKVSGSRNAFIERSKKSHRLHLRMEKQSHPRYFDLGLDHTVLSRPLYAPHHPHAVAAQKEMASWMFCYFEPRERMRAPSPVKEVRHIGLMGEELAPFLNTLYNTDTVRFRGVERALKSIIPSIEGISVQVNQSGEVELRLQEGECLVPASVVSEGTLRILGILSLRAADKSPAVIGFEEPENGVHPRRIGLIAELMKSIPSGGDTQLIVTTHSPILPNSIPDDSLFVCSKDDASTGITRFKTWGPLGRDEAIEDGLQVTDEGSPASVRILRGDFDA